jgi:hypothetical protein
LTEIYLETGKAGKKVFACAVDWPGWERWGRTEEAAIDALASYGERYAAATGAPTTGPAVTTFEVVERLPGTATTDFGAPDAKATADRTRPLPDEWLDLLDAAWASFDRAVVASSPTLRKGPRGGGRDRDAIADHVREAERSYGRSLGGPAIKPRTPWPEQRAAIREALRHAPLDGRWPPRYALRRIAWHVLDHLWEIEDKQP